MFFICEICKEWDGGIKYRREDEFAKHNQFIYADCDKTLTDERRQREEEERRREEERRKKEEEKTLK